jgi:hypothetical protein
LEKGVLVRDQHEWSGPFDVEYSLLFEEFGCYRILAGAYLGLM